MKTESSIIEEIYDEYSRKLYLAAYRILGNAQEAEDVMQDTLLKVCTRQDLSKIDNLGGYLSRSCINKSLDILRKRRTEESYRMELQNMPDDGQEGIAEEERGREGLIGKIVSLISSLPGSCRQIVSLKLIEGYDYQEIAQITSMNENSIRSKYMRGRQILSVCLKKEGISL